MGLISLCQRTLFQLVSPRHKTLTKLLAAFIVFVMWFMFIRGPQSQGSESPNVFISNNQLSKYSILRSDSVQDSHIQRGRQVFPKSVPTTWTENNPKSPTVSLMLKETTIRTVHNFESRATKQKEEKFKSKLRISQYGVLSPKAVKILPADPILREGDILLLRCMSYDHRSIKSRDAPYLNFELPEMPYSLEEEISISYSHMMVGTTMLRIEEVKKGHEGEYTCVSQNQDGMVKYNSVQVRVRENVARGVHMRKDGKPKDHQSSFEQKEDITALLERGMAQEKQVELFCEHHNLSHQTLQLPRETGNDTDCLYRHLLLNDKTNTLFCFAPKVGCTNLRVLFFIAQGFVPRTQLQASRDKVDQSLLEGVQYSNSFASRSDTQRKVVLRYYYKFIMYRNPLERLLSGYRSKVERFPLIGLEEEQPHYNWLRKAVYAHKYPSLYKQFVRNGGVTPVNISFSDFVDYWLTQPESLKIDEHFRSIFSLCQPCRTRFNFYGNFKDFNTDSKVLIQNIHSSPKLLRQGYYSSVMTTEALTQRYYKQLSRAQKLKLVDLIQLDLDFYHHLFPDEKESNQALLGL